MNDPKLTRSLILLATLAYAPAALAYLDPGTGSMIMSAIIGLFATAALAIKTYWYRLKRLITRRPAESETGQQDGQADEQEQAGRDSG
jgi:hypothetical protein